MTDILITDVEGWIEELKTKFAPAVAAVETDIVSDAKTTGAWIETNGYPLIMQDALALITGALTGTSWALLVGTLTSTALAQGKTLVAGAADVALNLAKAQLVVAGTVAPTAPVAAAS